MSVDSHPQTQTIRLTVETDLEKLTDVVTWFEQFKKPLICQQTWLEAQIAIVEGFTNAVQHAHQHLPPSTPIALEVQVSSQVLRIWIWDQGKAFDFDLNLQAMHQITSDHRFDPLERQAHWGSIILLKLMTDKGWQIAYERPTSYQNCLKLEKNL
ncbi:MAG: anti-sigma regulatory factor [Acaryochloris sp. RU_4_1]|nr:anti-sigma regulatory factor [Acaryochloris sp. RU_4_1]NJR53447.1 anti-sigma regulatory factor [Acaryochloris sp. CRU_2_0]